MILCIEVYPAPEHGTGFVLTGSSSVTTSTSGSGVGSRNNAPTPSSPPPQPIFVQYASLVSAIKQDNDGDGGGGIIWSIGRRSGSYHLSTDKTVSREHCRIKIGTTVASRVTNQGEEEIGIRPLLVDSNSNTEAYKECNESKDKLCILIENIGKLGTYIINECHEDTNLDVPKSSARKASHGDGSDSETDDEMDVIIRTQQQQQQSMQQAVVASQQLASLGQAPPIPLSTVTESLLRSSQQKVRSIEGVTNVNETKVLSILTLRDNDDDNYEGTTKEINRRCIIQIGKLGSTVVIRRMPSFQFIPSGVAAKRQLEHFQNQLYKIGCYIDDPSNEINHRVNIHHLRKEQSYRIMPWNKPTGSTSSSNDLINLMRNEYGACTDICYIILTTQYTASLKQLIAWTCGIPIVTPAFLDGLLHHTISSLPLVQDYQPESDTNAFWSYPISLRPDPQLWKNYYLLSLPKKKKPSTKQYENDYDLEQLLISAGVTVLSIECNNDDVVLDQVRSVLNRSGGKDGGYFIIGPEANMKKTAASKVTYYYENLVTSNFPQEINSVTPKQIAKYITTQSPLFPIAIQPPPEQVAKVEQPNESTHKPPSKTSSVSISNEDTVHGNALGATKENSSMDIDPSNDDTENNFRIKAEEPSTPILSTHRMEIESSKVVESDAGENIPSSSSFTSTNNTNKDSSVPTESIPTGRVSTNSTNTNNVEKSNDPNPKRTIINRNSNSQNGWIQALPKKRKGLSVDEIRSKLNSGGNDDTEYEIRNVAITEHVKGLIVTPENRPEVASNATATSTVLRTRTNVPNFKTFRKNNVIADSVSDVTKSKIRLRSVLPKESDNRRDREEQQQELEEQQRRADELFGDANTKVSSQRRRR